METNTDSLSLTRKLLSFNTINPPGLERDCAEYLGKLLEAGGFQVSYHEYGLARTNLVARLEAGEERLPICFTGHMDTAPLGLGSWTKDPFGGEIEDNKIYGRGTSDMKGGVAAMVAAALRISKMQRGKAGVILIITAGEETGSEGACHIATLGEKLGKAGAMVVGEPTSNYPIVAHKGSLWLEARTTGVTAHGSMPDQGINAIYRAVEVISGLREFDFAISPHPLLGSPTINVGTISGGLNIRTRQRWVLIFARFRVWQTGRFSRSSNPILERMLNSGGWWMPFLKEPPVARGVTYFTDASFLTPAFDNPPTIILGPGEATQAHKTDEFCYVDKIKQAAEAYFEIAKNWCGL
jgi:succinyl-diaminopimelate desuccinylase